jgi:hypothetical protein
MSTRISVRQFVGALLLSSVSFGFGFAYSRCIIDAEIRQAHTELLRSTQDLEREQITIARQFEADYELLEVKLNTIRAGKEKQR